jgi:hypothetical protein
MKKAGFRDRNRPLTCGGAKGIRTLTFCMPCTALSSDGVVLGPFPRIRELRASHVVALDLAKPGFVGAWFGTGFLNHPVEGGPRDSRRVPPCRFLEATEGRYANGIDDSRAEAVFSVCLLCGVVSQLRAPLPCCVREILLARDHVVQFLPKTKTNLSRGNCGREADRFLTRYRRPG